MRVLGQVVSQSYDLREAGRAVYMDPLPKNWTSENWNNQLAYSPQTREGSHEEEQVFGGADCDRLAARGRWGTGARGAAPSALVKSCLETGPTSEARRLP